jgi:hypothetical protein
LIVFVGPTVNDVIYGSHAILEFLLAGDTDVAEEGAA